MDPPFPIHLPVPEFLESNLNHSFKVIRVKFHNAAKKFKLILFVLV
jgi:hypothetical protein